MSLPNEKWFSEYCIVYDFAVSAMNDRVEMQVLFEMLFPTIFDLGEVAHLEVLRDLSFCI